MLVVYNPVVDEHPDRRRAVGRGNRLTGKHPDCFGCLLYSEIDYEIYTNVLHRHLVVFARIRAVGDRKMYGASVFYNRISANSRFITNVCQ